MLNPNLQDCAIYIHKLQIDRHSVSFTKRKTPTISFHHHSIGCIARIMLSRNEADGESKILSTMRYLQCNCVLQLRGRQAANLINWKFFGNVEIEQCMHQLVVVGWHSVSYTCMLGTTFPFVFTWILWKSFFVCHLLGPCSRVSCLYCRRNIRLHVEKNNFPKSKALASWWTIRCTSWFSV